MPELAFICLVLLVSAFAFKEARAAGRRRRRYNDWLRNARRGKQPDIMELMK